jgi:hypothetical protein
MGKIFILKTSNVFRILNESPDLLNARLNFADHRGHGVLSIKCLRPLKESERGF